MPDQNANTTVQALRRIGEPEENVAAKIAEHLRALDQENRLSANLEDELEKAMAGDTDAASYSKHKLFHPQQPPSTQLAPKERGDETVSTLVRHRELLREIRDRRQKTHAQVSSEIKALEESLTEAYAHRQRIERELQVVNTKDRAIVQALRALEDSDIR